MASEIESEPVEPIRRPGYGEYWRQEAIKARATHEKTVLNLRDELKTYPRDPLAPQDLVDIVRWWRVSDGFILLICGTHAVPGTFKNILNAGEDCTRLPPYPGIFCSGRFSSSLVQVHLSCARSVH
jgi:hypothetical protein